MAQFSCRLVTIKYRLAPPIKGLDVCFSTFASSAVAKVPVLTIFGATPAGQRTCLHVHGVFPYVYVPCTEPDPGERYLRQLAGSINHALQLSLRVGPGSAASEAADHVFKITVVKGIPFYGYHASEEIFLKIYLYNPALVKRLCDLLLAGAVMNQVFQPHEAHIPFRLQFMIDYNLAGMNYVNLSAVKFRPGGNQEQNLSQNSKISHHSISSPPPLSSPLFCSPSQQYWDVNNLPSDAVLCVPRLSVSELEVDGLAADICRDELSIASKGYPGLATIWEEERQRRRLLGMETTLTPPPSPVRESFPPIPNDERLKAELNEIIYERLGLSSENELEGSPSPSPALLTCSQSCDLVVHEPTHTSDITSSQSTGAADEEELPVVDEEAIQQSIELSQRLSVDALRKSTDTELLGLLMDLDQTQPPQHSSQSVADSLIKSRKSRSSSLFGSPSSSSTGPVVDKPDPDAETGLSVFLDCCKEDVCGSSPKDVESGDELLDEEEGEEDKDDAVFDSQFVPCGQQPREVPAEKTAEVSRYSQSTDVQLEYDMSEIRVSQLEASCDPLLGRLHESPLCPSKRGHQETASDPAEGETANSVHEASEVDSKHVDMADSAPQLSASQRRRLISLCSLEGEGGPEQLTEEEVGELEHSDRGPSGEESEDDDIWLTQQGAQDSCKSTPEKDKDDSWTQYLSDSILQLDGMSDPQKNVQKKMKRRQYPLRSQGGGSAQESTVGEPRLSTHEAKREHEQPLKEKRKRVRGGESQCSVGTHARTKKARSLWPGLSPRWAEVVRKYSQEEMLQMAVTESLQGVSGSSAESNASPPPWEGEHEEGRETQTSSDPPTVGEGLADSSGGDKVMQGQHASTSPTSGELLDRERLSSPPTLSPLSSPIKKALLTDSNEDAFGDVGQSEDSQTDFNLSLSGSEDNATNGNTNSFVQFPLVQLDGTSDPKKKVHKRKKTLGMRKQYPLRSQGDGSQRLAVTSSSSPATCTASVSDEAQRTEKLCSEGDMEASSGSDIESGVDFLGIQKKSETSDTQSQDSCVSHSSACSSKTKRKISLSLQKSKKKRTRNVKMESSDTPSESSKNIKSSLAKLPLKPFHIVIERLQESVVSEPLKRFYESLSAHGAKQDHEQPHKKRRRKRARSAEPGRHVARTAKARSFWPCLSPRWAKVVRKYSEEEMLQMAVTESLQAASGSTAESTASPPPLEGEGGGGRDTQATWGLSELPSIGEAGETDLKVFVPVPDWELKHSHDLVQIPSPLMDEEGGHTDTSVTSEVTQEQCTSASPISGEPMDSENLTPPLTLSPLSSPCKMKMLLQERTGASEDASSADEHSETDAQMDFHLKLSTASDSEFSADDGKVNTDEDVGDSRRESSAERPNSVLLDSNEKITASKTLLSHEARRQLTEATPLQRCRAGLFSDEATDVARVTILPLFSPPTCEEVLRTAHCHGLPRAVHTEPFYSDPRDVQTAKNVGGRTLRVPSRLSYEFPEFSPPYEADLLPLSAEGLSHWKAVIGSINQIGSPPLPLPAGEKNQPTGSYSTKGDEHDALKWSTLSPSNPEVIVPVLGPPSSQEIMSWYKQRMESAGMPVSEKEESNKASKERARVVHTSDKSKKEERSLCNVLDFESDGEEARRGGGESDHAPTPTTNLGSPNPCTPAADPMPKSPSNASCLSTPSLDTTLPPSLPSYQLPSTSAHVTPQDLTPGTEHPRSLPSVTPSPPPSAISQARLNPPEPSRQCPVLESTPGPEESVTFDLSLHDSDNEDTPVRSKQREATGERGGVRPRQLPFTPIGVVKRATSQLEGPTPTNSYGFKISQSSLAGACNNHEVQHLTSLSVELHTRTRGSLRPDPEYDPVLAVFYYLHHDWTEDQEGGGGGGGGGGGRDDECCRVGVIAIDIENCKFVATTPRKGRRGAENSPSKAKQSSPQKSPSVTAAKGGRGQRRRRRASPSPSPAKRLGESPVPSPAVAMATTLAGPASGRGESEGVVGYLARCGISLDVEVTYVSSEIELLEKVVQLVRRTDPDLLLGYEVNMSSWGYLLERADMLGVNLVNNLSRLPNISGSQEHSGRTYRSTRGEWRSSGVQIVGRIVINVWRTMRHELALTSYTFENVAYHVLHERVPLFSHRTLTTWYDHSTRLYRCRVVEHYLRRCHGNYKLLEGFNVIGRTSEFSRLYGIEFEDVLNRGSQYRVESMMLRLAKPANFIAVSPSVQQRARMAAPECIPLVLEPESRFYSDPVLVLDFQSLYPSMMIAYNYCFSTCLGRLANLALHGDFSFGTNTLNVPTHLLKKVKDDVHISPNGIVFVKSHVRKGIIPRMVEEILNTRVMVKHSMKQHKANKALNRILDARQLGLKLLINTTYGYTAASFSGRMPCMEVADSIVGKSRETLERAIQLVNSTQEWRARVVYGDTDSLFVLLKGASKDEAFRIGREICDRVAAENPKPVKLKFEKVYLPCILQSKKRYVGYAYESPEQKEPQFDAKGIETVRRDSCPAVPKVLEKSLRLLFSSRDVSQVKAYVQRQCSKLLDGNVSIQDYTFAKEYRGRQNYRPTACVPALELTKQGLALDRRSEPQVGERVPYVIVHGSPGQPLIRLVRRPEEVVSDPTLRLNGTYYITKQILPALDRALSLMGINVYQWYRELPRVLRAPAAVRPSPGKMRKGTIGQYFASMHCPVCEQQTLEDICDSCRRNPQKVAVTLSTRMRAAEVALGTVAQLCQDCVGSLDTDHHSGCVSLDCPLFYRRQRAKLELERTEASRDLLHGLM